MKFISAHVSFIFKFNTENGIKIRWSLTKLQTNKINRLLFMAHQITITIVVDINKKVSSTNWPKRTRTAKKSISTLWATVYKTVRPMLSVCPVCLSVSNIGVLWPNGWMDQDATWQGGRPQPRPHCVRWGPSSPQRSIAPIFCPCLLWPNGWMDQDATWHWGRPRPRPCCVRWRPGCPKRGTGPQFSAHVCCGQTVTHLSTAKLLLAILLKTWPAQTMNRHHQRRVRE